MAIKHIAFKDTHKEIDLDGPEGNAFSLLSLAEATARQLDYDRYETDKQLEDMKSSDYVNLIKLFDKHFGYYFTLYTKNEELLSDDK